MNEQIKNLNTELFGDIPEKEMLMYQAVIQMIQEDYDINSIKVSDITKRAGIGKGTAYEYFSSKEEIIVKAIIYDTYLLIKEVEFIFKGKDFFKEKYDKLLDFLEERISGSKSVGIIVRLMSGSYEIGEEYHRELRRFQQQCPCDYFEDMIDMFMKQGLEEGCFADGDLCARRHAFITQIVGYIFLLLQHYYSGTWTKQQARDYTYDSMIKIIGKAEA